MLDEGLAAANAQLLVLEAERNSIRDTLAAEKKSRRKLEVLLKGRLSDLHENRDVITGKMSGLETTLEDLTTRLDRTTKERDEAISREIKARKEMGSLKLKVNAGEVERAKLQTSLVAVTEELTANKNSALALGSERREMEQRVAVLGAKLKELSSLCDDADSLDTKLKSATKELMDSEKLRVACEEKVAQTEAAMRKAEEAFYRRLADVESAWKNKLKDATVTADKKV